MSYVSPFDGLLKQAKQRKLEGQVLVQSQPVKVELRTPDFFFMSGSSTAMLDSIFLDKVRKTIDGIEQKGHSPAALFYKMVKSARYPLSYNELTYIVDCIADMGGTVNPHALRDIYTKSQFAHRLAFYEYLRQQVESGQDSDTPYDTAKYMSRYDPLGEYGLREIDPSYEFDTTDFMRTYYDENVSVFQFGQSARATESSKVSNEAVQSKSKETESYFDDDMSAIIVNS